MNLNSIIVFLFLSLCTYSQTTFETKKVQKIITKFNTSFNDEYAWLENLDSEEVKKWVSEVTAYSDGFYAGFTKKNGSVLETIKLYNQNTTGSLPNKEGRYFYKMLTIDRKKSPMLFLLKDINAEPVQIIDPNKIYKDKNVNIEDYFPSKNSNYMAYTLRINGSDKLEMRFLDLNTKKNVRDSVVNIKFSNIAWNKDLGVFYKKNSNQLQFEKDSTFKMYYHRLHTSQENDELIFDTSLTKNHISFFTTKTKLFIVEKSKNHTKTNFYYSDLAEDKFELIKFYENEEDSFEFINYQKGRIYYSSNKFNWGEVRSFDILNKTDDKQIIPQFYNHLLQSTSFTEDYIICKYKTLGKTYLSLYDYEGKFIKKIESPIGSNIFFQNFDEIQKDIYFGISSYTIPVRNFKINLNSKDFEQVFTTINRQKPTVFPLDYFETKCITYKNRDNIEIPINIVYKKGLEINGNNPCLLEAYGGFGIVSGPRYDNGLLHFLDKGGIYAFAEIRGGGEKGKEWHKKGSGINKINSLNDFVDASEFLIKEKYTNPNKLAITGGSHGGLVVGYALTERPDLYKLALPKVGVFDMANKHKYTVGAYNWVEYGNPDIEEEYKALIKYSPLNKIKKDINYPTTIIFTADNDDRVPPFHSYKFAAALQNREAQKNSIQLITKKDLGHYGGNTYYKRVQEDAEFYDYLIYYLMKSK